MAAGRLWGPSGGSGSLFLDTEEIMVLQSVEIKEGPLLLWTNSG